MDRKKDGWTPYWDYMNIDFTTSDISMKTREKNALKFFRSSSPKRKWKTTKLKNSKGFRLWSK